MMRDLMREHGLTGWRFEFDNSVRRFGCCKHGRRTLTLSRALTYKNEVSIVRNVMLHEIAHALVGAGHGHDWTWKRTARAIGCTGDRCYDESQVVTVEAPWIGTCGNCRKQYKRHRLTDNVRHNAYCPACKGSVPMVRRKISWLRNSAYAS